MGGGYPLWCSAPRLSGEAQDIRFMTSVLAAFLTALVRLLTLPFGRWRRLTIRARVFDQLQPVEAVEIGGQQLRLHVPDRHSVYWARHAADSEPETIAWIAGFKPGQTVIDVGANVGLYALLAAARGAGRVVAVEPNPYSFAVLTRNVGVNRLEPVVVPVYAALSNQNGLVALQLSGPGAGTAGNSAHPATDGGGPVLPCLRLDDLVALLGLTEVHHLKIDVDGLEPEILEGGIDLLARPEMESVFVEFNDENSHRQEEIRRGMADLGYATGALIGQNQLFVRT